MKKKLLLVASMIAVIACLFAISVSAEDKIIKLDTCPTLEEIHANRDAYVSHLDAFDGDSLGEKDSQSVVVLSDLAEAPTYYVFPSYYYMRTTNNTVWGYLTKLNEAIAAADSTAFANYSGIGGSWSGGGCLYLIRYEVPTYVTSITGTSKFEGDANLLEVYFPTHIVTDEETGEEKEVAYVTSISGQNLFSSCVKLEYVHNSEFLPAGLVVGNQDGFAGCKSLKEIKIPQTATSIGLRCFNGCASLKEVVLPNSVTTVLKGAFANCSALEKFVFGAGFKTFSRVNVDYETLQNCTNLKYVYFPATFADSIEAKANDYKSIFSDCKNKVTFFVTADQSKAQEIFDKFDATNSNSAIEKAQLVAYDPNVDYTTYAETLGYNIIVYNYNACDAFYNGEHIEQVLNSCQFGCGRNCGVKALLDNPVHNLKVKSEFGEKGYFGASTVTEECTVCQTKTRETAFEALFESKGVSAKTFGEGIALVQGYTVDIEAIELYRTYVVDFDFGILAYANHAKDEENNAQAVQPKPGMDKVVDVVFDKMVNNYIEVKLTGIPDKYKDIPVIFCIYASENGNFFYLDDGEMVESVVGKSYNDIVG